MAGYSGTPLPQKLGIRSGGRVAAIRAPPDFAATLGALPADVVPVFLARPPSGARRFDVIVYFAHAIDDVERDLPKVKACLDPAGGLWLAWPKKTALQKKRKDKDQDQEKDKGTNGAALARASVGENDIRARGLAAGLVDNKVCAIDETWSGLRFVVRLSDRPPRPASPPKR